MLLGSEDADVVDQKMWGDEDEDENDDGKEQQGAPKFEEGSRLDGAAAEDEVRTRDDLQ